MPSLTLEDLTIPIRSIALQPLITGVLLAAGLQNPRRAEDILAKVFSGRLSLPTATQGLGVLVALGIAYRLNRLLSRLSLNNWTSDRTWDWSREIVLITGGSSGIGALIASQLAERGIKVVILDLKPPAAADSEIKGQNSNTSFYKTDVTSSSNIAEVAAAIRRDIGHPTVLINNAGIGHCKPILEETEAQIRATFEVNNIAHFLLVKEFLPHMIERNHGHVVTLASMASFVVWASNVDYSCTKAASLAFHEGLAQELRHRYEADKVRTTCVSSPPFPKKDDQIQKSRNPREKLTPKTHSIVHPTWVRTPLIEMLLARPGWNELTLETETVATAVVRQILKGESAQLVLPGRYSIMAALRGAPSWLQEGLRSGGREALRGI
jgi:all-trans-retinol dehydrogenase (NAD+)